MTAMQVDMGTMKTAIMTAMQTEMMMVAEMTALMTPELMALINVAIFQMLFLHNLILILSLKHF